MPAGAHINKKPYKKWNRKTYVPKRNLTKYQVKAVAQKVATKILNKEIETKFILDSNLNLPLTAIASSFQLTPLTQGTEENEMIGNKVRLTSLWINYTLTVSDSYNMVRLVLIQDTEFNDTSVLLQQDVFNFGSTLPIVASYNTINVPNRFKILYDKVITLDQDDPAYYGKVVIRDFPLKTLEFRTAPTTVSAIGKGHLYWYMVSDSGLSGHPSITYSTSLFYKDA